MRHTWAGWRQGFRAGRPRRRLWWQWLANKTDQAWGRVRLRRITDASAASLHAFLEESIEPGSVVHTDGWEGYSGLEAKGYRHKVSVLQGRHATPSQLMPRVHRVASLLKRWLLGTHQGAVSLEHLDYYLDEFTFRFNRRRSSNRGKLFYRLAQQAVAIDPVPYKSMIKCSTVTLAAAVDDHNL